MAPVDKLSLVLVALFTSALLGERPTLRVWAGGIVMVAGGVLVLALKR